VVDPVLATTPEIPAPTDGADVAELSRWLTALGAWLAAMEGSPFAWKHFLACTGALQQLGRFPTFESLRAARQAAGADVNIAGLLKSIARFFQDESRDLLAVTATRCVVVAEPEPRTAPPELLGRNLPEVRCPLRDGLLCLACDKAAGDPFAKSARIVTLPFAEPMPEMSIEGTISLIDPEDMTERLKSEKLSERFPVLVSPDQLAELHYEALLAGGEGALGSLITSIATSSYPGSTILPVRAGGRFWRSLEDTGILENRFAALKLLKICAAVVTGRQDELNVERRPLRETQAADSPQRKRESDKAKAWRVTITKEGAGYRLHYWHTPRQGEQVERVELANVLCEQDAPVIPES
jgi:hypothetical protein